eukprot:5849078-Prymnesium_polylepis.1
MSSRPKRERADVSYTEPKVSDIFEQEDSGKKTKRGGDDDDGKERRRSGRVVIKNEPIDAVAGLDQKVSGVADLRYSIGGADVGGDEASGILKNVETDEGLMQLSSQFRNCRRVVMWHRGKMVAAGVLELHEREKVMEIPILATKRELRQHGYGSVLVGLLMEVAMIGLGAQHLVVSATKEARRFWLRQ